MHSDGLVNLVRECVGKVWECKEQNGETSATASSPRERKVWALLQGEPALYLFTIFLSKESGRTWWEKGGQAGVRVVPQTVGEETRAGKVDDEEVDDELGDLQRREVLLPLRAVSLVQTTKRATPNLIN
jgi:hypothetical protein